MNYNLLHWSRSVPTSLGPTPLVTYPHRPLQAGGSLETVHYSLPPPPGGDDHGSHDVSGVMTDEAREKEMEG